MRAGPAKRAYLCSYCTGKVHIIVSLAYPNDVIAKRDSNGKWICGDCQEAQIQDMIKASMKRRGVS
jgi:hypothetical protein